MLFLLSQNTRRNWYSAPGTEVEGLCFSSPLILTYSFVGGRISPDFP